ncbi:MAG: 50S ribosomal protein L11 methyltransferase, partial [Anaerolineaceae bacterium]
MADRQEWLELSMIVSGELAEAVSNVLTRYLSTGVVIEKAITYDSSGENYLADDETRICGYILVDDNLVEKRSGIEQALWHLGSIQSLPEISYQIIKNQNWMEKWKEQYHPIIVGEKLLILPPWLDNPYPQRIPLRIDPNMAFGTGTHPTTQLCLKLTEKYLRPGMDVIDIGCGSGILSIASRLLGARHVLAVDIDPLSVKATQENAELNGIIEGIECGLGSVTDIKQDIYSIHQAQVVLANILAPV